MSQLSTWYTAGLEANRNGDRVKAAQEFRRVLESQELIQGSDLHQSSLHNLACQLYQSDDNSPGQAEALRLWSEAAEMGHPGSLYYLGVHCENHNDVRALDLFRRSLACGISNENPFSLRAFQAVDSMGIADSHLPPLEVAEARRILSLNPCAANGV